MKLVCPNDNTVLNEADIALTCPSCGEVFPIVAGIPRFTLSQTDAGQAQVSNAFAYKWNRGAWGFRDSQREVMQRFFLERFGFETPEALVSFFRGKTVLHAGIGSGQSEQHYLEHCSNVFGADISESVDACRRNWDSVYPDLANKLHLVQADIMRLPYPEASFDIVFSDGVLHHTPNTFKALESIVCKVKPGGAVVFYIYKKKAPIREFTDDYLRKALRGMSPQKAWETLEPLTALARDLSKADAHVTVTEPVELLGMPTGEWSMQRWLYWHIMKFYWNDAFTFDENNHVNFDWYYPTYAWRHTSEEVRDWLQKLGLAEEHFQAGESGLSVIARKPDQKRCPARRHIPLARPRIDERCQELVLQVLNSGNISEGGMVRSFEKAVRERISARHCLAATSCTAGLDMALRAIGLKPGDEVVVPDFTYPATASVVMLLGATPVLVDTDPTTMLVDYDAMEMAITPKTKAVLPVSLFGNPLDASRLAAIKKRHSVFVIEDAACALGAFIGGSPVGTQADVTVFSLHPRKTLTTGEGGLVLTNDASLAALMDSHKHFGMDTSISGTPQEAQFVRPGTNYKMSDILAALGLGQMEFFDDLLKERASLARRYTLLLQKHPGLSLPQTTPGGVSSYQSYCVFIEERDRVMDALRAQGVEVQIGTYALHRQPAFRNKQTCRHAGPFPGADYAFDHCLTLPMYSGMSQREQDMVVHALLREL